MKRIDDRTKEQKTTHNALVVGTDRFLSGWGEARDGFSYAAWACRTGDVDKVFNWVKNRSDMDRVRLVYDPYYPNPNLCAHLHIYVVNEGHPSLA